MRGKYSDATNRSSSSTAFSTKLETALGALREAYKCAEDTGCDLWEFAVGIRCLYHRGLDDTDLRWLLRKGLIQHAREVTRFEDKRRKFQAVENLSFCKKSCFTLTPNGIAIAERSFGGTGGRPLVRELAGEWAEPIDQGIDGEPLPHWDPVTRELWIGETIVKRFKWQAVNQEIVLSAFEEDRWPVVIDDPLPPKPEQDTKRRLHDTIKALNRNQEHNVIRFHGNGTGEGIRWELTLSQVRQPL